jgi:hypothetical protein
MDEVFGRSRIGSARRECPDQILGTSERHLRLVLDAYIDHCHACRPHRTLNQNPPAGRAHPAAEGTSIHTLRRDRLGGLNHEYV